MITLFFFQNQYNDYHNARLLRKVKTVIKDLNEGMAYERSKNEKEEDFSQYMHEHINSLVKIHNLDMNVFDRKGNLVTTSQPDIFDKGLLSRKMEPLAYLNLEEKGKTRYVHDEHIGDLKFLSAYLPFENDEQGIVAYLNFPYYGETTNFEGRYFLLYCRPCKCVRIVNTWRGNVRRAVVKINYDFFDSYQR